MDPTDFAIYRYLSPDGQIRFWGSRRVVDPLLPVREIAEQVKLSEAGVRARLKNLEKLGYLRGRETWVNPALFGASLVVSEIPVPGSPEAQRLLSDLSLVDGAIFARDILDEKSRAVLVYYLSDSAEATLRRSTLLRKLSPGGQMRGPIPYWLPPCTRELTSLDWRILQAFRRKPNANQAELAEAVGISLKTTGTRFHQLVEACACWSAISSSSEEMPLAMLEIGVRDGADPLVVARAVADVNESWMPIAADGFGVPAVSAGRTLRGLVPAEATAALEHSIRRTLIVPGVANIHRTFALGSASYPQWADDRIAAKAKAK